MFVTVDSSKEMIGTFSPQTETYTHEMPEETTPSGMFARGAYSARSKVTIFNISCASLTMNQELVYVWIGGVFGHYGFIKLAILLLLVVYCLKLSYDKGINSY